MAPTNPASGGDSAGTQIAHAPDAIIYIPHLGGKDSSARVIADRAAHALDLTRLRRPPHFEVVDAGYEKYPRKEQTYTTSVLTLRRELDGATQSIADLYELDYHDNLTRRWQERGLLAKWALLAATILVALVPMLFIAVKKLIPAYEKALKLDPDHAPSLAALGALRSRQGRADEAERHLRRSVELDPTDYFTVLYRGENLSHGITGGDDDARGEGRRVRGPGYGA